MTLPNVVMQIHGKELYLVPGREKRFWCDTCKLETGYEIDMWGMFLTHISSFPLATLEGCDVCDDEGYEE